VEPNKEGTFTTSNLSAHIKTHRITCEDVLDTPMPGSRNFVSARAQPVVSASKRQAVLPASVSVSPARLTQGLLDIMHAGRLPYNFFSNPALIHLFQVMQPGYKIPHRTTMAEKAEEQYTTMLAAEKQQFIAHGCRGSSLQVICGDRLVVYVFLYVAYYRTLHSSITGLSLSTIHRTLLCVPPGSTARSLCK
jgi:hypothetical protein